MMTQGRRKEEGEEITRRHGKRRNKNSHQDTKAQRH